MNKILISLACFAFLVGLSGCVNAATLVVNQTSSACTSGNSYYSNIASAEADANAGDTIIVCSGTYNENIDVDVSIDIQSFSQNPADTIVNPSNSSDHVFEVTANSVNISGFTVTGATGGGYAGIYLSNSDYSKIENINATNNIYGIFLKSSNYNTIANNNASLNNLGITVWNSSNNNTIINNIVSNNYYDGVYLRFSGNNTIANNTANSNINKGISLVSSNSNTLANNTANSNSWYGIYLESSSNNAITDNTNSNSENGIRLSSSSNNTLINNTIFNNSAGSYYAGIRIDYSDYNIIANNSVSSESTYGIVQYTSNYNTISNNTVTGNIDKGIYINGILLEGGEGAGSHSNITGNNISNNGYGIYLDNEDNNLVTKNYVYANTYGIYLNNSWLNSIYHNNLVNNSNQAYDDMTNNTWDNGYPSGGNYWSDWTSPDANADSFVDIPYNISGGANKDYFPFVNPNGWGNSTLGQTLTGNNVTIQIPNVGLNLTFDNVTGTGKTTVVRSLESSGISPPSGYKSAGIFYNISTTANFTEGLEICVTGIGVRSAYRLFHRTGSGWEDITTTIDADNDVLCGTASSLSPFEVMELSSQGGNGGSSGGGGISKPKIILLANSIDYNLSSNFTAFLKSNGIEIIYNTPENFSQYKNQKFIVILGGPDTSEGVGNITREVLNLSEREELRVPGAKKMYVKTNVWKSYYNQVVFVVAGSDRDQTRECSEEHKLAIKTKVKG